MKKERTVTEFQIITERLQYLTAKRFFVNGFQSMEDMDDIFSALGTERREFKDGKVKYVYKDNSIHTATKTYMEQYKKLAKKLQDFYKAVDKLPDERTKFVCELRYVEGWTFKDIAKKLDVSLPTIYEYNFVIVDVMKDNNCEWAIDI